MSNTGHADMVQTAGGEWWMVALASRPTGGHFYNLGRETFLAPVVWEEGWPVVNPGVGVMQLTERAPALPAHRWPTLPACDHFDSPTLRCGPTLSTTMLPLLPSESVVRVPLFCTLDYAGRSGISSARHARNFSR